AAVESVDVSPDGRLIAGGYSDGHLRVWDVATGTRLLSLPHGDDFVQSVAFSPDGKAIATGCWDGVIRIFNTEGDEIRRVTVYKGRYGGASIYGRPHLAWTADG